MYLKNFLILVLILSFGCTVQAQLHPKMQQTLESLENLRISNRAAEALNLIRKSIERK